MRAHFQILRRLPTIGAFVGALLFGPASAQSPVQITDELIAGGPDDVAVIHHLVIRGTNAQIGEALARIARSRFGDQPGKLDIPVAMGRRAFFTDYDKPILERGKGVARAFGLSFGTFNRDFFSLPVDMPKAMGCSVAFYPPERMESGHATLSRYYDFTTRSFAALLGVPETPDDVPSTHDPYVMELYPDHGYASLAMCAYDLLGGSLDGVNSKGLSIALLADDMAKNRHPSAGAQPGLNEIEVVRFVLDNCADVPDAQKKLAKVKHYYSFTPCHYMIADAAGRSMVWEPTAPGKHEATISGATLVTNHLLAEYPDPSKYVPEPYKEGTFNRYCRLRDEIAGHPGKLSIQDVIDIHSTAMARPTPGDVVKGNPKAGRTLWHSIYDLEARELRVSFYLRDDPSAPGGQVRTKYFRFRLTP